MLNSNDCAPNKMFSKIRIVLVNTFHPGNIGSSARVMKNMGLSELYLVDPIDFPSPTANQMAAGAEDLLMSAKVVKTVDEAVSDCQLVMACTARPRDFDLPSVTPEEAGIIARDQSKVGNVAILFGPERFGLSNDDLMHARYRITIPTNPEYPSLNLASAVQIVSYEIRKAFSRKESVNADHVVSDLPSTQDVSLFYEHLQSVLTDTGFIVQQHPGDIMKKLRNLFDRAELERSEINILRGILASIDRLHPKK